MEFVLSRLLYLPKPLGYVELKLYVYDFSVYEK